MPGLRQGITPNFAFLERGVVRGLSFVLFFGVGLFVLAGCGGGSSAPSMRPPRTAKLQWLGHQSFLLTSSLGTKILTNPYAPGSVPHSFPPNIRPDVLLISNEVRTANNDGAVENFPTVFRSSVGKGINNAAGTRIRGTPTYPNPSSPDSVRMNLVFSWITDGMKFCFLGDIPSSLPPDEAALIGQVDVLFLPVGGRLGAADRDVVLGQLRPRLIIPMGSRGAVEAWAAGFGRVHRPGTGYVLLNREALPVEYVGIVLSPP